MTPFDERQPEEVDPQYEELMTLLQKANLDPTLVDPAERANILSQARARLFPKDLDIFQSEQMSARAVRELGSFPSKPKALPDQPLRRRRLIHVLNMLAAVLVIAALISASLLLFRHRLPSTASNTANSYESYAAKNGIMFGFDAQHTNANPFEHVLNPATVGHLQQMWTYQTKQQISSTPAVVGGVVYVGSADGNVYALDAVTGTKKWAFHTGNYVPSSPAVVGGVVYVGSVDGNVYALDAVTGTKKWAFHTGSQSYFAISSPAVAEGDSSPAVVGGVVYVAGNIDGNVYALDAVTGTKKWAFPTGSLIFSSPAVVGGVVYVCSKNDAYALDAATGTKKWAFHTPCGIDSTPAVAGGVVYIDSGDGILYALDAASGTKKWTFHAGGHMSGGSSPTVAGGLVYFRAQDGNVYALDVASGTKKWAFHVAGQFSIGPTPAVAGGVVYIGSGAGNLYAFHLPGT